VFLKFMMLKKTLINLKAQGKVVFVGDTHGDLEASQKVIESYLKPHCKIVFLGDYVDRGVNSKGNIDFLLKVKERYPEQVYLLLGNHDAYGMQECYPADFWQNLKEEEKQKYFEIFEKFPLVVSVGSVIALHGALPYVKQLEDINRIEAGDENWMRILWGDFQNVKGYKLEDDKETGRPQFGSDYFDELMKRFRKQVLVRAHQPKAPEVMYDKRCLTIFTSSAYLRRRIIAICDFEKNIKTTDDIAIEEI
jgi:predicted MPP superfamily phosphohydrolase